MSEMIAPCMASILAASRLSLAASRLTSSLSTATLPSKVDTKPWISLRVASRSFSRETNCSLLKVRGYKQNNAVLFQSQSVELEVEAKGGNEVITSHTLITFASLSASIFSLLATLASRSPTSRSMRLSVRSSRSMARLATDRTLSHGTRGQGAGVRLAYLKLSYPPRSKTFSSGMTQVWTIHDIIPTLSEREARRSALRRCLWT